MKRDVREVSNGKGGEGGKGVMRIDGGVAPLFLKFLDLPLLEAINFKQSRRIL